MNRLVLIAFFGLVFVSCSSSEDKGELIAKVYDDELYTSDLDFLFASEMYSVADSTIMAQDYIDSWINERILVQAANQNDNINKEKIDRKVASYKSDLLIMEMEQVLVNERLDTNVTDKEISNYYNTHQEDFQLNDYLVKVLYLKVPLDAPDIGKVTNLYKLNKETDSDEIIIYAKIYASNYYYDIDNWIYFDDLLKEIPLQDVNKDRFIMKRSKTRFEEGGHYYFLNVIDYKLKNTTSPLNFERNNIKERIINTRVKDLREQIKREIISKAYDKNEVTIYQ